MNQAASSPRLRIAAALLFAVLSFDMASGAHAQTVSVPPIPAGEARFWFYRVFFAGDSYTMPAVSMNGQPVGYALAGTSFYRDVPAGAYLVSVETVGVGLEHSERIAALPGQDVYVQIASMPGWDTTARGTASQPTHAVMLMSPWLAARQLPATEFAGAPVPAFGNERPSGPRYRRASGQRTPGAGALLLRRIDHEGSGPGAGRGRVAGFADSLHGRGPAAGADE